MSAALSPTATTVQFVKRDIQQQDHASLPSGRPESKVEDLSVFPAPPNFIPPTPGSDAYPLSARGGSSGCHPPSAFANNGTRNKLKKRRDSAGSSYSAASGRSGKSGLSVFVNGRSYDLDAAGHQEQDEDSSVSEFGGRSLASPVSGHFYYTAPSTPLDAPNEGAQHISASLAIDSGPSSDPHAVLAALRREGARSMAQKLPVATMTTSVPGNGVGLTRGVDESVRAQQYQQSIYGVRTSTTEREDDNQSIGSAYSNATGSSSSYQGQLPAGNKGSYVSDRYVSTHPPLSATGPTTSLVTPSATSSSPFSSSSSSPAYPTSAYPSSSSPYPPSTSSSVASPTSPYHPRPYRLNVEMGMSARAALNMLSPPATSGTSSSSFPFPPPNSKTGAGSSVPMIRPPRRESSLPPPRRLRHKPSREAIGCPPTGPLPPIPTFSPSRQTSIRSTTTTSSFSTVGARTETESEAGHGYEAGPALGPMGTPRASVSLRSSRSHSRVHHLRKESEAISVADSKISIVPSMTEFGGRVRQRLEDESRCGSRNGDAVGSMRNREKARAKLRIDIPPSYAEQVGWRAQIEKEAAGDNQYKDINVRDGGHRGRRTSRASSVVAVAPPAVGFTPAVAPDTDSDANLELEREFGTIGRGMGAAYSSMSPTGSTFSSTSAVTSRSGSSSGRTMNSAQSLKQRVRGMLGGLEVVVANERGWPHVQVDGESSSVRNENPRARRSPDDHDLRNPSSTTNGEPSPSATAPATMGGSMPSSNGDVDPSQPYTSDSDFPFNQHHRQGDVDIRITSNKSDGCDMLTSEDIHSDPLLARAVTPITPQKDRKLDGDQRRRAPSPSPLDLDMTRMGRTLALMCANGGTSPTRFVPSVQLSQVPPLSDSEDDSGVQDLLAYRDSFDDDNKISPSLLGKFPLTPNNISPSLSSRPISKVTTPVSPKPVGVARQPSNSPKYCSSPVDDLTDGLTRNDSHSSQKFTPKATTPRATRTSFSTASSHSSSTSYGHNSSTVSEAGERTFRGRAPRQPRQQRGGSPDIESIICSTPRPHTRSKSKSGSARRKKSTTRRSGGRTLSRPGHSSSHDFAYGGVDFEADDFGTQIARHKGGYDLSPGWEIDEFGALRTPGSAAKFYTEQADEMLDQERYTEEGQESENDSDIDLHTPLPHILLREGVLSPHSKVLAAYRGSSAFSDSAMSGLRTSVLSTATDASFGSNMTKSGLFRDERDTEVRRRRHRDRKLLLGGLGLTTGLGWSDSEDEDAPSPLTHRLSSMTISRASSVRSMSSKSSSFLSQSQPPSDTPSRKSSTCSGRSTQSRSLRIKSSSSHPLSKSLSAASFATRGSMSQASSSTMSLPFPPTPCDGDDLSTEGISSLPPQGAGATCETRSQTPTAKTLKPKRSIPRLRPKTVTTSKSVASFRSEPGPGTLSSTDEVPPMPQRPLKPPTAPTPSPTISSPRPLRLPALQLQRNTTDENEKGRGASLKPGVHPGQSTKRGALLGYNRDLHDRQKAVANGLPAPVPRRSLGSLPSSSHSSLRAPSSHGTKLRAPTPSRSSAPLSSGQPRIGTGMAYRGSSGNTSCLPQRQTATPVGAAGRRSEPF